jgi:hypothetical protein
VWASSPTTLGQGVRAGRRARKVDNVSMSELSSKRHPGTTARVKPRLRACVLRLNFTSTKSITRPPRRRLRQSHESALSEALTRWFLWRAEYSTGSRRGGH